MAEFGRWAPAGELGKRITNYGRVWEMGTCWRARLAVGSGYSVRGSEYSL